MWKRKKKGITFHKQTPLAFMLHLCGQAFSRAWLAHVWFLIRAFSHMCDSLLPYKLSALVCDMPLHVRATYFYTCEFDWDADYSPCTCVPARPFFTCSSLGHSCGLLLRVDDLPLTCT